MVEWNDMLDVLEEVYPLGSVLRSIQCAGIIFPVCEIAHFSISDSHFT
jgi:hypothetical protein